MSQKHRVRAIISIQSTSVKSYGPTFLIISLHMQSNSVKLCLHTSLCCAQELIYKRSFFVIEQMNMNSTVCGHLSIKNRTAYPRTRDRHLFSLPAVCDGWMMGDLITDSIRKLIPWITSNSRQCGPFFAAAAVAMPYVTNYKSASYHLPCHSWSSQRMAMAKAAVVAPLARPDGLQADGSFLPPLAPS